MADAQEYQGVERRVGAERREKDYCLWHEAHEQRFRSNELKISSVCTACSDLRKTLDALSGTRVPIKLFYGTAGGVIFLLLSLLAFQWTSYERLNTIGLNHQKEMGEIAIDVSKVTSAVENERYINQLRISQMKDSIKDHIKSAETEYTAIRKSIESVEDHVKNHKQ